tara:strand:+ start:42 stop:557 length:516 start_codon:yes stop_codon:yes gene_type:complete
MNAYFFNITKDERENILDKHKEIYDGYVTEYAKPEEQPLYVQDFANDKKGVTVNNNGDVTEYKNVGINEMKHDGKSTGLFSDEEPIDEQLDMIGDGPDDLEHGTSEEKSLEKDMEDMDDYFEDSWEGNPYDYMEYGGFFDDDELEDEEDKEVVILSIKESLDMFKRFSEYN